MGPSSDASYEPLVAEQDQAEGPDAGAWKVVTELLMLVVDFQAPRIFQFFAYMHGRLAIGAIGFGLITMRKRAEGAPWFKAEEATHDIVMPCGDHLGAVFELADLLATHDDVALRDLVLRVAPDVVLDERMEPTTNGWNVVSRRVRQTTGLCRQGEVDPAVATLVGACDGQRRLGDVLAEVAASAEIALGELSSVAMPVVRRMIEQAFLLPVLDQ